MKHTCHVPGCNVVVPPRMLMCRAHWAAVPQDIKRRVTSSFNPSQCGQSPRPRPSVEWLRAAREAINAVKP